MRPHSYREHDIKQTRVLSLWTLFAVFCLALALLSFGAVLATKAGGPEDFMGPDQHRTTQWVLKAYVYNADQTVKIKEFTAGENHVEKKFASKSECEVFLAQNEDLKTALDELRGVAKKVDPTFVVVTVCVAEAAGAERVD